MYLIFLFKFIYYIHLNFYNISTITINSDKGYTLQYYKSNDAFVSKGINSSLSSFGWLKHPNKKSLSNEKKNELIDSSKTLNNKALLFAKNNNFNEAKLTIDESIELCKTNNLKEALMHTYACKGEIAMMSDDFFEAYTSLCSQLKLSKELKNKKHQFNALYKLGLVYYNLNENNTAIDYFSEAISLSNSNELAKCYLALGKIYTEQKKEQKAIHNLNKAIKLFEKTGAKELNTESHYYLAEYYFSVNNVKKTVEICTDWLGKVEEQNTNLKGHFHFLIANCYEKLNDDTKNKLHLDYALKSYKNSKNITKISFVYSKLSQYYTKNNLIDKASGALQKKIFYSDLSAVKKTQNNFYFSKIEAQTKKFTLTKNIQQKEESDKRKLYLVLFLLTCSYVIIMLAVIKNKKIKKTYNKLLSTNEVKNKFINNISKELNSPLVIIDKKLKNLKVAELSKENKTYVKNIQNAVNSLKSMTHDIYDFKDHKSEKIKLIINDHILYDALEESFNSLELEAEKRNINYISNLSPELKMNLMFDKQKTQQVILNLIKNALKFTSNNGTVKLIAEVTNQTVNDCEIKIQITDTGKGILHQNIPYIFDEFYQEDSEYTRSYTGTGLGLSISQKIIQLMNSKIEVKSEREKGSIFYFILNLKKA